METISGKVTKVGKIKDYGHDANWGKTWVSIPKFFMEVESKEHGTICAMVECKAEEGNYGWRIPESEERQRPLVGDQVKFTTHRLRENGNGSVWASVTWSQDFKITRESKRARKERKKWIAEKKQEHDDAFKEKVEKQKLDRLDCDLERLGHLETQKYDERLPEAVSKQINKTFDFDTILSILRDTVWFVTPEGEGGKQCYHDPPCGCGYPGSGMRRPGGVLHGNPASIRKSILDKAVGSGLVIETEDGFKATRLGVKTLVGIDTCPVCNELRKPFSTYSHHVAYYPSGPGVVGYPRTAHHGACWYCSHEKQEIEKANKGSNVGTTFKEYKKTKAKLAEILKIAEVN